MSPKKKTVLSLILTFGLASAGNSAYARFLSGMSEIQVSQEITVQLMRGVDLATIAKEAHAAGIKSEQVTVVMLRSGRNPGAVVAAVIKVDQPAAATITAVALASRPNRASEIMAAALSVAPKQRDVIVAKALTVPMINPSEILGATASGENQR